MAQQPAPESTPVQTPDQAGSANPNADPRDNRQRQLTPEEEREREIRQFDPLYHGDSQAPVQTTPEGKSGSSPGRDQPRPQEPSSDSQDAPVPGSIASGERSNAAQKNGPQVIGDGDQNPDSQEYTGPAVLSRAYTVNRPMIAQDIKWRETFGLGFTMLTGATSGAVNSNGTLSSPGNYYGLNLSGSFGGRKIFHKDQFGILVSTQYLRSFPSAGVFNGPNINVSADYTHTLSRRFSLNIVGTGTSVSQNYSVQNPQINPDISLANVNLASSPNIQIFDTSVKQFNLQTSLTFQLNPRLSFNFGGGYFAVIRNNPNLIGTDGEQAQGDVNYRWSQKTTVGSYYSYSHYQFQHGAGSSDTNTVGLIYSYAFTRTLQLRIRGGLSRIESLGLTEVALNPVIAALLGQTGVVIDLYRRSSTSDVSAQIVKDFRGGRSASISFVNGISPGNGLYQTSKQQSIAASYGAKLRRIYQVQLAASRDSLSAVSQVIGNYSSETARVSISRGFPGGFSGNMDLSFRHIDVVNAAALPSQIGFTSGITWSPPNGRVWPF